MTRRIVVIDLSPMAKQLIAEGAAALAVSPDKFEEVIADGVEEIEDRIVNGEPTQCGEPVGLLGRRPR